MQYIAIVVSVVCFLNECVSDRHYDEKVKYSHQDYINKSPDEDEKYYSYEDARTTDYPPLKDFLERYVNKINNYKNEKRGSAFQRQEGNKPKSWNLLHISPYHQPSDDKKGWVTLDAVPWSISKVSKWESNHKPNSANNWEQIYNESPQDGHWLTKPTHEYNYNKPHKPDPRPAISSDEIPFKDNLRPWDQVLYHKENGHKKEHCSDVDIITDGLQPNFPVSDKLNRRHSSSTSEIYPATHPSNGDGEWILLSTTKGYKYPKHKRRSLQIASDSVSTHRSVYLTVLPPVKNSKVNMTTSHGGLLEVESTFQTVDQAQKEFVRKERNKQFQPTRRPLRNYKEPVENVVSTLQKPNDMDSSAVVAAVGAGMIPATMAMLVPMAMSGKKKRSIDAVWGKKSKETLYSNVHKFI